MGMTWNDAIDKATETQRAARAKTARAWTAEDLQAIIDFADANGTGRNETAAFMVAIAKCRALLEQLR